MTNFNIRKIELRDYLSLHKIWTDPGVVPMSGTTYNLTEDDSRRRVEMILGDTRNHQFVIEMQVGNFPFYTNDIAGVIGLVRHGASRRMHTASISVMIRSEYQGKGLGTELFKFIIDYARSLGVKLLELDCFIDNHAGLALYKKFGFQTEGVLKKRVERDGEFKDLYMMSLEL